MIRPSAHRVALVRIASLAALLALAAPLPVDAQRGPVPPGARVRVTAPGMPRGVDATYSGRVGDTLSLLVGGSDVRVPAGEVIGLERSTGRSVIAGARHGLLWGLGVGIPAALSAGILSTDDVGQLAAIPLVYGFAGAAIGAAVRREGWRRSSAAELADVAPEGSARGAPLADLRSTVPRGARVRVSVPGASPVKGNVFGWRGDTLLLGRDATGVMALPGAGGASRVEVSRGRSAQAGALRGAAWGGGGMFILGLLAASGPDTSEITPRQRVVLSTWMAMSGALSGVIVGGLIRREVWSDVLPAPRRNTARRPFAPGAPALVLEPRAGGVSGGLRWRW